MPMELTTAVLLAAFALLCGSWLVRTLGQGDEVLVSMPVMGPTIEPDVEALTRSIDHVVEKLA